MSIRASNLLPVKGTGDSFVQLLGNQRGAYGVPFGSAASTASCAVGATRVLPLSISIPYPIGAAGVA